MATQQKEFLIRVAADIKSAQQLAAVPKLLNDIGAAGSGAAAEGLKETSKSADDASTSVEALSTMVKRFVSIAAAIQIAKAFVEANVEIQALQATLTAATGGAAEAGAEYQLLAEESNRLGLSITALGRSYAQLIAASKGTVLEGQATRDIFIAVAEASSVLKLSASESERAIRAIQQMMSKGTVSAEELRLQLGDVIPGAMQLAARAAGVTTEEFQKMLAKGEVLSNDFLPKLAEEFRKTFGPGVEQSASNMAAEFNRLKNSLVALSVAIGEAGVVTFLENITIAATGVTDAIRLLIQTTKDPKFTLGNQDAWGGAQQNKELQDRFFNTGPPVPADLDARKAAFNKSEEESAQRIRASIDAIEKLTQAYLKQEIALRDGEAGMLAYNLSQIELSKHTTAAEQALFAQFNATVRQRTAQEQLAQASKNAVEATRKHNAALAEGARITASFRTPMEALAAEVYRLDQLLAKDAITWETYTRAVYAAQAAMDTAIAKMGEMDADTKKFASTMEGAFSTLFFDVMDGNFENMADNFSRALKRMVAEMLASRLFQALGGAGTGGAAGASPGTPAPVSPPGQFSSLNSGLSARSTGITKPDGPGLPSNAGAGGQVMVTLENKGTPQTVQQGRAQFDARGLVVSLVTDDLRSGGPIATTLERTYNTRRKV